MGNSNNTTNYSWSGFWTSTSIPTISGTIYLDLPKDLSTLNSKQKINGLVQYAKSSMYKRGQSIPTTFDVELTSNFGVAQSIGATSIKNYSMSVKSNIGGYQTVTYSCNIDNDISKVNKIEGNYTSINPFDNGTFVVQNILEV